MYTDFHPGVIKVPLALQPEKMANSGSDQSNWRANKLFSQAGITTKMSMAMPLSKGFVLPFCIMLQEF